MVRHDDEAMQQESAFIPVTQQSRDQEFRVGMPLEQAEAVMRHGGERVGLRC